jgi:hypothetical protein
VCVCVCVCVETLYGEGSTHDDIGLNTGVILNITTATDARLTRRIVFALLKTQLDLTIFFVGSYLAMLGQELFSVAPSGCNRPRSSGAPSVLPPHT